MELLQSVASFYWDPPREAFTIPYFNHPVVWYGILFVAGFILAYFIINPIFARFLEHSALTLDNLQEVFGKPGGTYTQMAYQLTDRLCWFVVAGTVIGARLGEVFFYEWPYFEQHPEEIFKVWHGGLSSHGGVLGVMIALFCFTKYMGRSIPELTFLRLLDYVSVPSPLVACFIRLGNFMNQEIIGTPTDMPWGVVFGHPADHGSDIARHPVQLYEAFAYLASFFILWTCWKKQKADAKPGAIFGLLLILIFGSRFIFEFWKSSIPSILDDSFLQIGQILSIPYILLGLFLYWRARVQMT